MTIQVPPAGTYTLDPAKTRVSFAVKHMFGAGTVKGTFDLDSGSFTVADPASESTISAAVDAASVATGNAMREKVVRSNSLLGTGDSPSITFMATTVSADDNGSWSVHGTLTAKGQAAPVTFAVTESEITEWGAHIVATARVDRYAHGITGRKGMVGQHLDITVDAHAVRDA